MTFRKGHSGNPGGRGSDKLFRQALLLSLKEADGDFQKIRRVTDALVAKAIAGNVPAIALIAERIDGKVESDDSARDDPLIVFKNAVAAADSILENAVSSIIEKAATGATTLDSRA